MLARPRAFPGLSFRCFLRVMDDDDKERDSVGATSSYRFSDFALNTARVRIMTSGLRQSHLDPGLSACAALRRVRYPTDRAEPGAYRDCDARARCTPEVAARSAAAPGNRGTTTPAMHAGQWKSFICIQKR